MNSSWRCRDSQGVVYLEQSIRKRQNEKKNIWKTKEAEREQIRLLGAESTATDKAISRECEKKLNLMSHDDDVDYDEEFNYVTSWKPDSVKLY